VHKLWAKPVSPELPINLPHPLVTRDAHPVQPRARGTALIAVDADENGRTCLRDLRQSGSTKVVFPQSHTKSKDAILVNTAGGITGGDKFEIRATVASGATLTLTTQAAERAYRAQPDETGQVATSLDVAAGGQLNWLPQELILFDQCALHRKLDVALSGDAGFLMVEPMVFGRTAMREHLSSLIFRDRVSITRDGRPLYLDGADFSGDVVAHLRALAIARGAAAMASLVMVRRDAGLQLDKVRSLLPETAGATLLSPDVLVVRHLALDGFTLRRDLVPLLDHLTDNSLPTSWRL
jgi:urease accessory protein